MNDVRIESLDGLLSEIGEDCVAAMLAGFSCPLNREVENYLRCKALQSQKMGASVTYLVMRGADILGYFTLLVKAFQFSAEGLSKRNERLLRRFSRLDAQSGLYNVAIYLIAQIGKNYASVTGTPMTGAELLETALSILRSVQAKVGGKLVMVERELERAKLLSFYEANGFKSWSVRADEGDGVTYDQMLRVLERVA